MSSPSEIPIGSTAGKNIRPRYLTKERIAESLKFKLAHNKVHTGYSNCPPCICDAKRIFCKIIQATDGLTGGSDVYVDFGETGTERDDEAGDEDDDDEFNNND